MRRRDISLGLFAAATASTAGAVVRQASSAQTCTAPSPVTPYNVRDYGAVGDGCSNDHDAIQTALNLAGATGNATVFFPRGNYFVGPTTSSLSGTLTISGNMITLYGEGWASQVTSGITIIPQGASAPAALFTWAAAAGGTQGQFLQVQSMMFNGNSATSTAGNGHCFSLSGVMGTVFANFPTFRDCYFGGFNGSGQRYDKSAIGACGIYVSFGDEVKIENCVFQTCNQGVLIDGDAASPSAKVCVSACTFDACTTYGLQASFVDDLLINNQTTFNQMPNGVYLGQVNETATIDDCRFKSMSSGSAILAVGNYDVDQINITNNYFYTVSQSVPSPVVDVGTNCQGVQITGNEFLFDYTVVNGLGIVIQNPAGFAGGAMTILSNRFVLGGGATLMAGVLANNASDAINSLCIVGNYFGQAEPPGAGQSITTAVALTGSAGLVSPTVMNNTFAMSSPGSIGTAISIGSNVTGAVLLNNSYIGGAITTPVADSGQKTVRLEAGSQTSLPSFDTLQATGGHTASFSASNKPGSSNQTGPSSWLPVVVDGATMYIPLFSS